MLETSEIHSGEIEGAEENQGLPKWAGKLIHTGAYRVRLHRTREELAKKIIETGFSAGADLASTTTGSGSTPEDAFSDFKRIYLVPNKVVIIHIPKRLFALAQKNKEEEQSDGTAGESSVWMMAETKPTTIDEVMLEIYEDKDRGGIVVPKEWIFGFADQTTLELVNNPKYDPELKDPQK